ncbi:hypothetical protein GCM10017771_55560 [Streptomyces capitiformicae]|uniref:Uncharacterized protein n=1 Tax=Streptomyces capitiformicae TaxID=2014920 RepID=A0A919DF87_9ACTN|nr:hypothetical protein GCM10017771_55560 [Streptomyces capitiformicae]
MPGHGEVVFLDGEGFGSVSRDEVGGGDRRVTAGARQHLYAYRLVGAALGGLATRLGTADEYVLAPAEQQNGVVGCGAREVPHIGRARHERRRAAARMAALPQPLSAGGVDL